MMDRLEKLDQRLTELGTSMPLGPPGGKGGYNTDKGGYNTDFKLIPPKEKTDPEKYTSMKQREANGKNPCLKYIILGKCDFGDKCNRCHEASNWNFSATDKEVAKRELERGRKNSEIYRKSRKLKATAKVAVKQNGVTTTKRTKARVKETARVRTRVRNLTSHAFSMPRAHVREVMHAGTSMSDSVGVVVLTRSPHSPRHGTLSAFLAASPRKTLARV